MVCIPPTSFHSAMWTIANATADSLPKTSRVISNIAQRFLPEPTVPIAANSCSRLAALSWKGFKTGTKTAFKAGALMGLEFGLTVASTLPFYSPAKNVPPLLNSLNLAPHVPKIVQRVVNNYVVAPIIKTREIALDVLPSFSGNGLNYTEVFYAAAIEEIAFRGIIQQGLLRKLPQCLLEKNAPRYTHLIDHPISKIARATLVAMVFAISHSNQLHESQCSVLPQFLCGLLYGCASELTESLSIPIFAHTSGNLLIDIAVKNKQKLQSYLNLYF